MMEWTELSLPLFFGRWQLQMLVLFTEMVTAEALIHGDLTDCLVMMRRSRYLLYSLGAKPTRSIGTPLRGRHHGDLPKLI